MKELLLVVFGHFLFFKYGFNNPVGKFLESLCSLKVD